MKLRFFVVTVLLIAGVLLAFWWKASRKPAGVPVIVGIDSATPPKALASATPLPSVVQHAPSPAAISILKVDPKATAIMALMAEENAQLQNYYGKIVDQYGNPVVDADVTGYVTLLVGIDSDEKREEHIAKTDSQGLFEFTGLRGASVSANAAKAGYTIDYRTGYKLPAGGKTKPDDRAILTMWRLKGADPMAHKKIEAGLSCDGSPMTLDLLTGHRVPNGGDVTLSLTRNPVNIDRSKPFDWSLTLTVTEGGLVVITDPYPNEAPAEGYEPSVTKTMHAGPPYFTGNKFDQSYYLKSRKGQVYGRMKVHISADYQPPPARLEIEVFANPSGSRNLEYDPSKQAPAR